MPTSEIGADELLRNRTRMPAIVLPVRGQSELCTSSRQTCSCWACCVSARSRSLRMMWSVARRAPVVPMPLIQSGTDPQSITR